MLVKHCRRVAIVWKVSVSFVSPSVCMSAFISADGFLWNLISGTFTTIQGTYKLSEDFAKQYFHKYWAEIHDVTILWKRNVCSFIVTLNALDVRPTCDTADVQAILPFPPNPLKHVLCDVPYCSNDCRTIPNVTFTVCNRHKCHDLATLPTQVMA
jgi:hypothetical protein